MWERRKEDEQCYKEVYRALNKITGLEGAKKEKSVVLGGKSFLLKKKQTNKHKNKNKQTGHY